MLGNEWPEQGVAKGQQQSAKIMSFLPLEIGPGKFVKENWICFRLTDG